MNVLHVLSQYEVTGAEVYAATLVEQQAQRGHTLFVVSDTLTVPFRATTINIPIGQRSYARRLANVQWLVRFVREQNIHVLHAHSRAASWVCSAASFFTKTPVLSTVHGRQHLHPSSKALNVYGKYIIAVCESIQEHLISDLGIDRDYVSVIPNGFSSSLWKRKRAAPDKRRVFGVQKHLPVVSFIGRLTGPKGDVVRFLLKNALVPFFAKKKFAFCIVGGSLIPNDIPGFVAEANRAAGTEFVFLLGFQKDITPHLAASDIVIGSGRIAIKALLMQRHLIAFGESQYVGIIDESTLGEAIRTNFGDAGTRVLPEGSRVINDLETLLRKRPSPRLARTALDDARSFYDIKAVERSIQRQYQQALMETRSPATIPVLMYHRIVTEQPAGDSLTGLTVTARQFEAQLRSLQQRGFSTLTFREIDAVARREQSLPARPILLTFDDGYEDNYSQAFPLLQQFGMNGVVYLVADRKRRTNFWDGDRPQVPLLSFAQVREMARHGIEFGSHTLAHPHLPSLSSSKAKEEIRRSKFVIEDLLGTSVVSFAYPYGEVSDEVKAIVADEDYRFAVAADNGPLVFYRDPYQIRRTQVFPWTGRVGFWKKTQPWYQRYKTLKG